MDVFERIEKKFWMNQDQADHIMEVLKDHIVKDAYGESIIMNIYYDTPNYALIRRSIERPYFKEKIRLRSYGIPNEDSTVFLELKRKHDGIGYKRRLVLPFKEAKKLMKGEAIGCKEKQIEEEIREFVKRYKPEPKVMLTYKRKAFYMKNDHDFRITFDRDLRYKKYKEGMDLNEMGNPIMDDNRILMEIKTSKAIPLWLTRKMSELKIYQAPFSKIGSCYSKYLVNEGVKTYDE